MTKSANAGRRSWVGFIGGGVTLLFGIIALVVGLRWVGEGQASAGWPAVPGTVTRVEVSDRGQTESAKCTLRVEYSYTVADKLYAGTRYSVSDSAGPEHVIRPLADELIARPEVPVYYDPENPSRAVLRPGAESGPYVLIVCLGVVPIIMGVWLLWQAGSR